MSTQPIPLNLNEQRATDRLPCDGVPRYKVGSADGLTYSEAYDAIAAATGSQKNDRGGYTFHPKAIKRLATLNESHRLHIKRRAVQLDAETQQQRT